MTFKELRLKQIRQVVKYTPSTPHWHAGNREDHIVGVILSGNSKHTIGDRTLFLAENCIFFLNQREDYDVEVLEKGTSFSVHFTTYEPIEDDSFCIRIENCSAALGMLSKLSVLCPLPNKAGLEAVSRFYSFLAWMENIRMKSYSPRSSSFDAAKDYMNLHFREKGCADEAARLCGVSRRRFNDLFTRRLGISPSRYITVQKISCAQMLLQLHGMSVTEAASQCGFSDVYYFSRVFKAETGLTPSEYRVLLY